MTSLLVSLNKFCLKIIVLNLRIVHHFFSVKSHLSVETDNTVLKAFIYKFERCTSNFDFGTKIASNE